MARPATIQQANAFDRIFVRLGAALFVGSLLYFLYTYLVRWSAAADLTRLPEGQEHPIGPPWWHIAVNAGLFGVFAAHHSLLARDGPKAALARLVPESLLRSLYVWIASLLFIAICACWLPIAGDVYTIAAPLSYALAAVQLVGVWLIAQAVRAIDPLELAGVRPASTAVTLQVAGAYRLVRHPLYLGWILLVFGSPHMTGNRLAFAITSTLYLVVAIPWEERSLRRVFGGAYDAYREQVRWRIVPFVY